MHVFQLGKPYPVHNIANGQDKVRADLTPAFFSVCCYLNGSTAREVAAWQGAFEYGLYEAAPGIAFVLTRLAGGAWLFDTSLNWHVMAEAAKRTQWAEHANPTPLAFSLPDAGTNVLRGYRHFLPAPAFVAQVRAVAREQLTRFTNQVVVEVAIAAAERMPLAAMAAATSYHAAPTGG